VQTATPSASTNVHPAIARCDALAADPNDPTRAAAGVADNALSAAAAITACTEATQAQPGLARARFQLGRALLAGGRQKEAVAAFQQAANVDHPGALAYLGTAYQYGAGGLPKSQAKADQLHAKADSLGYGTQAAARGASAGSAPKSAADMKGNYEQPTIVRAVYFGDASLLPKEHMFTVKYVLTQAEILAEECKSFKLSEIRGFQDNITRAATPSTQAEALEHGKRNLTALAQALSNPRAMADLAAREQRLEDAPAYAAHDIVEFTKHHGACGSAPLQRYTSNMRNYLQQASRR
jgi:tetratricopeptide (TPR) repeat protein